MTFDDCEECYCFLVRACTTESDADTVILYSNIRGSPHIFGTQATFFQDSGGEHREEILCR